MGSVLLHYARVERPSTGSWLTLYQELGFTLEGIKDWVQAFMPGWKVVICCADDPDWVDWGQC